MPPDLLKAPLLCLFSILVLIAALKDLTSYTIPNWVSAALALAFAPAAILLGVPLTSIGANLATGFVMLLFGIALFALKWIGGGDAKLMAAASLWVGLGALPRFVVFTGLAGGVLALVLLTVRSAWIHPFTLRGPAWARRLATPGASTPYGVAIAAGALAALSRRVP